MVGPSTQDHLCSQPLVHSLIGQHGRGDRDAERRTLAVAVVDHGPSPTGVHRPHLDVVRLVVGQATDELVTDGRPRSVTWSTVVQPALSPEPSRRCSQVVAADYGRSLSSSDDGAPVHHRGLLAVDDPGDDGCAGHTRRGRRGALGGGGRSVPEGAGCAPTGEMSYSTPLVNPVTVISSVLLPPANMRWTYGSCLERDIQGDSPRSGGRRCRWAVTR